MQKYANYFFWRTWDQKEIDFIEERDGKLFGFELKWSNKKIKLSKDWIDAYPEAEFSVLDGEGFLDFTT